MKVLHLISGGDTGGAKTSVLTLLKELKELMEIRLVCLMKADFFNSAIELGIDGIVLQQKSRFDLSVVEIISKMIRDEAFNLVICHGARANFIGAFIKKGISVPIVTTIHSDYLHDFDNSFYKKLVYTAFNAWSLRKMNYYIVMANRFKDDLIHRGYSKNIVYEAYNGISMEPNMGTISPVDFAEKYSFAYDPNNIYVGTASRLHPVKGVDVLLRAAQRVKEENNNIKFLIAGTGDEKYNKKYRDFVTENDLSSTVFFLGFVEDMDSFYQLIDVNTISSHSEAVCYALLEGGKYYKPSIASKVGGTPELLEENVTGVLFEDDNDKEYAEKLIKLINNPKKMNELGNNLYQKVKENFSEEAMAIRIEKIYIEIIERWSHEKEV